MAFIKLDAAHQEQVDALYGVELAIIKLVDGIELKGRNRWLSIGRTDIEKGFMSLRKGITERFKESSKLDE
jgi:hypothetical protein